MEPVTPPPKATLRAAARSARRCADPGTAPDVCRAALAGPLAGVRIVAGYWPAGSELDDRPLLQAVAARGIAALPVVPAEPGLLLFRRWEPATRLVPGRHKTLEPPLDCDVIAPEAVVVPLLAFDRHGRRLGQGGGYYDRTLAALRARPDRPAPVVVGLAFACQEVSEIPVEPHDEWLDWVVTERGVMDCKEARRCGSYF